MIKKIGISLLIVFIGVTTGSLYGVLHDQVTYGISPEYYTKFKFITHGLSHNGENIGTEDQPEIQMEFPRFWAGVVGLRATWWVGTLIGLTLGLVGFMHVDHRSMYNYTLKAITITLLIAIVFGFVGYLLSKAGVFNGPERFSDDFNTVGSIHNMSYLGGLVGLVTGVVYSIRHALNGRRLHE